MNAELLTVPGGRRRGGARATGAPQAIATLVDSVVNALLALDVGDGAQRATSLATIPYPALDAYLRGQRAAVRLGQLDSMLALGPVGHRVGRVGTLVAARLYERAGDLQRAERALGRWPPTPWALDLSASFLSTLLRERGRLAERLGRRDDALRFYRHYLGIRGRAEPAARAADEDVRASVVRLEKRGES